jgi:hypothetical protein
LVGQPAGFINSAKSTGHALVNPSHDGDARKAATSSNWSWANSLWRRARHRRRRRRRAGVKRLAKRKVHLSRRFGRPSSNWVLASVLGPFSIGAFVQPGRFVGPDNLKFALFLCVPLFSVALASPGSCS